VGAEGLWYLHETLMTRSTDEPFSLYGLVAEGIKTPKDRSWVVFKIRSGARFHDGKKITTDDVIFSFKTLTEKGHPFYKSYFRDIENVEKITEKEVKFTFKKNGNRELPLIIAEGLPILSKDYWSKNDFTNASLNPPIGSGPYKIKKINPGRSITYERYEDYWAKNLPINRGKYNFNEIRFDYYRDQTVAMEAFKADFIKVVFSTIYREIFCPIILISFVGYGSTWIYFLNFIWSTSDRGIQARVCEIIFTPIIFR
jgi:microcin C transport system substrate-binding protein